MTSRLVLLSMIFCFSFSVHSAHAQDARLTPEQRHRLLEILPRKLADFRADETILVCLEAGRLGDDQALYALMAIDHGRDLVKTESDLMVSAFEAGATPKELHEMRSGRVTPERTKEMLIASRQLMSGLRYCQSLYESLEGVQ